MTDSPAAQDAPAGTELQSTGYEIFIAALSVLSLVNITLYWLIPDDSLSNVVLMMDGVLSVVFFGDFLVRLWTAPSRSGYFLRGFGWADLLASIPVASFKILRLFRLVRVARLLSRLGARTVARSLVRDRAGSALFILLLIAFLVLEFGALAILHAEQGAEGANIQTAQDAVWYLLVTMSTVGYGDRYPVTANGRVIGSAVIVIGVGIFGTLTGFLANAFVRAPDEGDSPAGPDTAGPDAPSALSAAPSADPGGTPPAPDAAPGLDPSRRPEATRDEILVELQLLRAQHQAALARIDRLLAQDP